MLHPNEPGRGNEAIEFAHGKNRRAIWFRTKREIVFAGLGGGIAALIVSDACLLHVFRRWISSHSLGRRIFPANCACSPAVSRMASCVSGLLRRFQVKLREEFARIPKTFRFGFLHETGGERDLVRGARVAANRIVAERSRAAQQARDKMCDLRER